MAAAIFDFPVTDLWPIEYHPELQLLDECYDEEDKEIEEVPPPLGYHLSFYALVSRRQIAGAINPLYCDQEELESDDVRFYAKLIDGDGLPQLNVWFSRTFPQEALTEAISGVLERNGERLLPAPEVRDLGLYSRLWTTYTLEKLLQFKVRIALHEWNAMLVRLESAGFFYTRSTVEKFKDGDRTTWTEEPPTAMLSWNLDDAEGATVRSGETLYSRTKRIIRDQMESLERGLSSA